MWVFCQFVEVGGVADVRNDQFVIIPGQFRMSLGRVTKKRTVPPGFPCMVEGLSLIHI